MARTRQTRKRSGGPIRRRPMKRRRRTRSRRDYGINKASQRIHGSTSLGGRLLRRRAYRGLLWRSSIMSPKYMFQAMSQDTINTPANYTEAYFKILKMLPTFTTAASYHNRDGADFTTINGKVLLRGGLEKLMISSESTETIACTVYIIYVKPGASAPASGALPRNTPVQNTTTDLGNEAYKVLKRYDVNLEHTGGQVTLFHKFKIKRYDWTQWTNGSDCLHWVVAIANTYTGTAVPVSLIVESNASVCVDVTA